MNCPHCPPLTDDRAENRRLRAALQQIRQRLRRGDHMARQVMYYDHDIEAAFQAIDDALDTRERR